MIINKSGENRIDFSNKNMASKGQIQAVIKAV
jgi:hypothetical protein